MRYVIAMVCALLGAALAGRFIGSQFAPWAVRQFSYESPDGAANVEQFAFLATLAAGLVLGWIIGWLAGARFGQRPRAN